MEAERLLHHAYEVREVGEVGFGDSAVVLDHGVDLCLELELDGRIAEDFGHRPFVGHRGGVGRAGHHVLRGWELDGSYCGLGSHEIRSWRSRTWVMLSDSHGLDCYYRKHNLSM